MKWSMVAIIAVALAGCFETTYHWTKVGLTQQQLNADWYSYAKENTTTDINVIAIDNDRYLRSEQNTDA